MTWRVALVIAAAAWPGAAAAQGVVDRGVFVILRGGRVVGSEVFEVRRPGPGGGFTVSTTASYPAEQPAVSLAATVELGRDSLVASARFEFTGGDRQLVLVDVKPRRITVRLGSPGQESTREFPAGARVLLAHDSLFALYAMLPGTQPGAVSLLWPHSGRRAAPILENHGLTVTQVGGVDRALTHLTLGAGQWMRQLWFDAQGRLWKVVLPDLGLTAVRRDER